jgi:hypothetical protein
MPRTTLKATELLQLEREYWEATRTDDSATMERLTADAFVLVQGEGVALFDREETRRAHDLSQVS